MDDVWIIKTRGGSGWVRERYKGQPIITGVVTEAEQFPTREAAELAVARFPHGRLPMDVIRSAAIAVHIHGDEPGGMLAEPPRGLTSVESEALTSGTCVTGQLGPT